MKKFLTIFALLLFVIINSTYSFDFKKYEIKSGKVEYKVSGMGEGTQTLYFDDWGTISAEFVSTITKMFGMKVESKTLNILDKYWSYSIDLKEKNGTKIAKKDIEDLYKSLKEEDMEKLGRKIMEDLDAKQLPNETILGKSCEVWEIPTLSSKVWTYKMVPLKTEMNIMGKQVIEAVSFEENIAIPKDKLQVPKGIKITEEQMTEEQKQQSQEMMKMMQGGEFDLQKMQQMIEESNEATEEEEGEGKK